MKKIFIFFCFNLIFLSPALADWKKFGDFDNGSYYVETKSITRQSGYLYFWKMIDFRSVKVYIQGDCKIKRIKTLSYEFYTGRRGTGKVEQQESVNKNWKYPPPGRVDHALLKKLC